jgi:hypothetical protein
MSTNGTAPGLPDTSTTSGHAPGGAGAGRVALAAAAGTARADGIGDGGSPTGARLAGAVWASSRAGGRGAAGWAPDGTRSPHAETSATGLPAYPRFPGGAAGLDRPGGFVATTWPDLLPEPAFETARTDDLDHPGDRRARLAAEQEGWQWSA